MPAAGQASRTLGRGPTCPPPPPRPAGGAHLLLEQLSEGGQALLEHLLVVQALDGRHGLPGHHRHQHALLLLQTRRGQRFTLLASVRMSLNAWLQPGKALGLTHLLTSPTPYLHCNPQSASLTKLIIHLYVLLFAAEQLQGSGRRVNIKFRVLLAFPLMRTCSRRNRRRWRRQMGR